MFPLTITLAHLAVALLLAIEFASADQCYWKATDQARKDGNWFSCGTNTAQKSGGAELCCMTGSECGEDSICRASSNGTAGSEWYVGGCTDSTYNDPACRDDCSVSIFFTFRVYLDARVLILFHPQPATNNSGSLTTTREMYGGAVATTPATKHLSTTERPSPL